jgi:hypothetical protein
MDSTYRPARILVGLLLALAFALASTALGQGRPGAKPHAPPGHAKKRVTTVQAVVVTRDVLVAHGYEVVRVEKVGLTQVIYYRRGNNGRGRGHGPLERLIVKPAGERVIFESAPPKVLVAINVRLGL